jgi:hypothetical protein
MFAALLAGIVYIIPKFVDIDFTDLGSYLLYGLGGLMIAVIGVLFIGLVVRVVWTGIMNRADSIAMCCPDNLHGGVHLVCSHYNPGGETSEGFSSYFHYYVDAKGKLYLSKKVKEDGKDLSNSIQHLAEQLRLQLDPDIKSAHRIGSYDSDDIKGKDVTIKINKGELRFRGYEGLIDYGFKVSFYIKDQMKWSIKL